MTYAGHPPATGTVQFTDGTTTGRSRAADSPLGRAALTALRVAPLLDGRPWRWRLHDGVAELWADRVGQRHPADPLPLLVCGAALHRTRIALAAAGWDCTVDRLPDPDRPEFLALLRAGDQRSATCGDAQTYRTVFLGHPGHPAGDSRVVAAPPSTLYRLRDTAESSGAGLRLLGADEPDLLAAFGVAADGGASHAILYARSDTAR